MIWIVDDVETKPGMARIYREENERRTDVKLSIRDRDMGSVVADAQRAIVDRMHGLGPLRRTRDAHRSCDQNARAIHRAHLTLVGIDLAATT